MNEKILVVDDELPIRKLLEKVFCNDYQVFCAADAFEALEILKKHNISLIVSDQRMPGMSGVEMFESIIQSHPQTIRILLSGYIEKNDLQYALQNNLVHKFIAKPWSIKELKSLVVEAFEDFSKNRIEKLMVTV